MARSLKKGPYIEPKLLAKIKKLPSGAKNTPIKTWARASQISPEMIGYTFGVHNGKDFINVTIAEEMVGHRLGEFSPTRKFTRHGGKMQKEIEAAAKIKEQEAAKAAKAGTAK
jgi:small subunit ribosomal protein S19